MCPLVDFPVPCECTLARIWATAESRYSATVCWINGPGHFSSRTIEQSEGDFDWIGPSVVTQARSNDVFHSRMCRARGSEQHSCIASGAIGMADSPARAYLDANVICQQRDVGAGSRNGGKSIFTNVQPIEQILAELFLLTSCCKETVRKPQRCARQCEWSRFRRRVRSSAPGPRAKSLACIGAGRRRRSIQEKMVPPSASRIAFLCPTALGEGPLSWPEQFGSQQGFRQGGTFTAPKSAGGAQCARCSGAGKYFLSRAVSPSISTVLFVSPTRASNSKIAHILWSSLRTVSVRHDLSFA